MVQIQSQNVDINSNHSLVHGNTNTSNNGSGQIAGSKAQALDPQALAANGAEEFTQMANGKKKPLSSRKKGLSQLNKKILNPATAALLAKSKDFEKLRDKDKIKRFIRAALKGKNGSNQGDRHGADILAAAEAEFGDVTFQYIALAVTADALNDSDFLSELEIPDTDIAALKSDLSEAKNGLYERDKTQINAHLNIRETASSYQTQLKDTDDQVQFYYSVIKDYNNKLSSAYQSVIKSYPGDEFSAAVEFTRQALTVDLKADTSSLGEVELQLILKDILVLNVLENTHASCNNTAKNISSWHDTAHAHDKGPLILTSILELHENQTKGLREVSKLKVKLGIKNSNAYFRVLNSIQEIIDQLPDKVFESNREKQSLKDRFQKFYDQEVEKEDT